MAAATVVVAVVLSCAPTAALAAGNGYGGKPVLPTGGVPGGFTKVLLAVSVTARGIVVHGKTGRVVVRVVVPRGAAPLGEQLVLTAANYRLIRPRSFRDLPPSVRHGHVVYALGVLLQRGRRPVVNRRPVTLTLTDRFRRTDAVVVYSAARQGFTVPPRHTASVAAGKVVYRFRTSTQLVVLAR